MATYRQILDEVTRKPGAVWQTDSGNWSGKRNDGTSYGGMKSKAKAQAWVKGADPDKEDDSGQDEEEPKPEKELEKKPKTKPATGKTKPNVPGGSPALVKFVEPKEPETIVGINKLQSDLEAQRAQGIAGAGGQVASHGESIYCNTLNSLDNDDFKKENATAIEKKKETLKIYKQDEDDLEALGLSPDSPEGIDYLATREVFADIELAKIKGPPPNPPHNPPKTNNVLFMSKGFKHPGENPFDPTKDQKKYDNHQKKIKKAEDAYAEWMKTSYDGALATRKVLKEDTALDVSQPHTTMQSTKEIDDKVVGGLEAKLAEAEKAGNDKDIKYYKQEVKDFQHFREYHDTYTVGVDVEGRTHIVSISNKKGSDLKDPQNNTTPARRFNVIKDKYGEKVAKEITTSLNTNIKKVRETKIKTSRAGTEISVDDELIAGITVLGSKYTGPIDEPTGDYEKWLEKEGLTSPSSIWPDDAKEKLELRNKYVKEQQGQFDKDNDRLQAAIESGKKPTDDPPDGPTYKTADGKSRAIFRKEDGEVSDTPNNQEISYNTFGRLFTKLGEQAKKGDAKVKPSEGGSLSKCIEIKNTEAGAVSEAHQQVINDVTESDKKAGYPDKDGNNGPHTRGYIDTVMDAMHFNSYIDGGDGKMIVQMGARSGQPSQVRGCIAELTGYDGDTDSEEGKKALKEHMQKRCSIDEEKGNILIMDGGKKKVLCEDTFRTAGVGQKVTSGFGSAMRECLKGKIDEKRASKKVSEQNQYESLEGTISRMVW